MAVVLGLLGAPASYAAAVEAELPTLPEPMIFDLVRPLNSGVGESEVNTLLQVHGTTIDWAPEVEWVFAPGHALEVELPIQGFSPQSLKMAYQATLGGLFEGAGVHGLQAIGKYHWLAQEIDVTALYLLGYRFDRRWSTFWMIGGHSSPTFAKAGFLLNGSVFMDVTSQFLLGLETNTELDRTGALQMLIMPQSRWDLEEHWHIQYGIGALITGAIAHPASALRVSLDF